LRAALRSTPGAADVDKVIAQFAPGGSGGGGVGNGGGVTVTAPPPPPPPNPAKVAAKIKTILGVRATLRVVPGVGDALRACASPLLREIGSTCGKDFFQSFLTRVDDVFEPDVVEGRSTFAQRTRQVFAVKGGVDAFLDLARRSFCETTEAAHELLRTTRELAGAESLRLTYSDARGFQLSVSAVEFGVMTACATRGGGGGVLHSLQRVDGRVETRRDARGGGDAYLNATPPSVKCTTSTLERLNARHKEAMDDAFARSAGVVDELVRSVRDNFPALGALSAALSLLDVLLAFAAKVMNARGAWTRPAFTSNGPLAIEEGRHPLMEGGVCGGGGGGGCGGLFVPNSTFLSDAFPFSLVTGPNMSGKSTYARQVATLVVLAHAGCYVPASFFSCPPIDAIYARVGTGDSLETDASSFMVEMREMQHILANATRDSLVLVDELGRSTSSGDGERVAWACAEALLRMDLKCVFATHADRLRGLATMYPGVRVSSLSVRVVGGGGGVVGGGGGRGYGRDGRGYDAVHGRGELDFRYKLVDGECVVDHYGLRLAATMGFPNAMMDAAWAIAREVDARDGNGGGSRVTTTNTEDPDPWGVERARRVATVAQRAMLLCAGDSDGDGAAAALEPGKLDALRRLQTQARALLTPAAPNACA